MGRGGNKKNRYSPRAVLRPRRRAVPRGYRRRADDRGYRAGGADELLCRANNKLQYNARVLYGYYDY